MVLNTHLNQNHQTIFGESFWRNAAWKIYYTRFFTVIVVSSSVNAQITPLHALNNKKYFTRSSLTSFFVHISSEFCCLFRLPEIQRQKRVFTEVFFSYAPIIAAYDHFYFFLYVFIFLCLILWNYPPGFSMLSTSSLFCIINIIAWTHRLLHSNPDGQSTWVQAWQWRRAFCYFRVPADSCWLGNARHPAQLRLHFPSFKSYIANLQHLCRRGCSPCWAYSLQIRPYSIFLFASVLPRPKDSPRTPGNLATLDLYFCHCRIMAKVPSSTGAAQSRR